MKSTIIIEIETDCKRMLSDGDLFQTDRLVHEGIQQAIEDTLIHDPEDFERDALDLININLEDEGITAVDSMSDLGTINIKFSVQEEKLK